MEIKELIPDKVRLGNGLIIKYKDRFLFVIGKEKFWKRENGKLIITYTGVGGKLEKDEDFVISSIREAKEEINSDITLNSSKKTLYFDFDKGHEKILHLKDKIKPLIIYKKTNFNEGWFVCVYSSAIKSKPKPESEIPAIILLKRNQISEEKTLKELLKEGAEIIEKKRIPRNAILRPYGSAEILRNAINKKFIKKIKQEIESVLKSETVLVKKKKRSPKLFVTIAYPDTYYYGLPNLGHQVIYRELANRKDVDFGRVYLPGADLETLHKKRNIPLFTWESYKPVMSSDIIFLTIPYEGIYTNVLKLIELSKIPIFSYERNENHPLIIGGGACPTYNPEPLSMFFDAFVIGDGEEVIHKIIDAHKKWRTQNKTKKELLLSLSKIEGVYVPSLFSARYNKDGCIKTIKPNKKIRRVWIKNLNRKPAHSVFLTKKTLYKEPTFSIEVARGCKDNCRFCFMGYVLRKPRVLSLKKIVELVKFGAKYTRNIKLFFEGLEKDFAEKFFKELEKIIDKHKINLKLGSLKADLINEEIIRIISKGKVKCLIIAPETTEGKLRNLLNKGEIKDKHILDLVDLAYRYGISNFGLYILIGLPKENNKDIRKLVNFFVKIKEHMIKCGNKKGVLEAHINPLFPKPFTPMQWVKMESLDICNKKLGIIKKQLSKKFIVQEEVIRKSIIGAGDLKKKYPIVIKTIVGDKMVFIQPMLSRGDRRMGYVIYDAYNRGDNINAWKSALKKFSINHKIYFKQKKLNEKLPWSVIDSGVKESYLKSEWIKSLKSESSEACKLHKCRKCGVC